ncbi:MAG: T9SS type A sorting domain-containing protein [Candidatus Limisoma sp.]
MAAVALVANSATPKAMHMATANVAEQPARSTKVLATPAKRVATPVKVMQKASAANGFVQLSQMSDGRVAKTLCPKVMPSSLANFLPKSKPATKVTATGDLVLSEGFEGWDGEAYDWIPENWQDVSKTDPAHVAPGADSGLANLTWTASNGGFEYPYEGDAVARIQVSIADEQAGVAEEAQDEWLITPSMTIAAGSYLSFHLSYSPGWTLFDMDAYMAYVGGDLTANVFGAQNNILEVLVSEDNGTEWVKIWDVMEDAVKYTEDELWNDAMSMSHPYITVLKSLNDYAGKTIQIAFRYVGQSGESMCLDFVEVGELTPQAFYYTPANVFGIGLSHDWLNFENFYAIAPAYNGYTWYNGSEYANAYSWEYEDPENTTQEVVTIFSEDENLAYPAYGLGIYNSPILTASLESATSQYQSPYSTLFAGANMQFFTGDDSSYFGGSRYDAYNWFTNEAFGLGLWGQSKAEDDNWGEGSNVIGYANLFEAPEVPYALSLVYFNIRKDYFTLGEDSKINLAVYKVDDYGVHTDEPLATSSITADDLIFPDPDYPNFGSAVFYLQKQDGELVENVDLTIDSAILVEVSLESAEANAETDDINWLSVIGDPAQIKEFAGSYLHLNYKGNARYYPLDIFEFRDGSITQGLVMNLGITNNWLFEDSDNYQYDYVDENGGDATFTMNSLYSADAWELDGEGLDDWYTYTTGDYDPQTGLQTITFTLDALPDGVDERVAACNIKTFGVSQRTFYIAQRRQSGVASMKNNANRVSVVNGNFVVKSSKATAVEVYNVAGQKVAASKVNGTAFIPAANLAKGTYMVKFNDNTVVKVMK